MAREQRQVWFSGRVQGVGFRYTTCQIAAAFQVTGYVRNLPDGSVLVVAEGEAAELDRFVAAIQERMRSYLRAAHVETLPATGEFDDFSVRY